MTIFVLSPCKLTVQILYDISYGRNECDVETENYALRIIAQRLIFTLPLAVASIYGQQASPPEQQLAFQPYHASGMYETGDTVGWIVHARSRCAYLCL